MSGRYSVNLSSVKEICYAVCISNVFEDSFAYYHQYAVFSQLCSEKHSCETNISFWWVLFFLSGPHFIFYLDVTEKCRIAFSSFSCFTKHLLSCILSASCHYWLKLWLYLILGENLIEFRRTKIGHNKLRKKLEFGSILILEVLACMRTWRQFWPSRAEIFGQGRVWF